MSKNIIWKVEDDVSFRETYSNIVGERIQLNPKVNVDSTLYKVGSNRVTDEQIVLLNQIFDLYGDEDFIEQKLELETF